MKNNLGFLLVLLGALAQTGCGWVVGAGAAAGGIYATKPGEGPPADVADQIPPHDSWCYHTMGEEVECFSQPQDTVPGRLVNVDPPSKYPLTHKAYKQLIAQKYADEAAADAAAAKIAEEIAARNAALAAPPVQAITVAPMPVLPKAIEPVKPKKPVHAKKKKHAKPLVTGKTSSLAKPLPPAVPNPDGYPPIQ